MLSERGYQKQLHQCRGMSENITFHTWSNILPTGFKVIQNEDSITMFFSALALLMNCLLDNIRARGIY